MTQRLAFRKAAWFIPAFFLNVLFLGTSHGLIHLPYSYWLLYASVVIHIQLFFHLSVQQYYDYASILLTVTLLLLAYVGFNDRGKFRAFLKVGQILSATFIPLGLEILAFDSSEWNIHMIQFQVDHNIVPWFTNADLFALVVSVCITAVALEQWRSLLRFNPVRNRRLMAYCRRLATAVKIRGGPDEK
ncbi:MAG: hypothetical protein JRN59_07830 [Nitrososphaerota archaeon]|nr:hypothetical protein [Nitrososphaerota archaeon]